jgi:hypothetical protein
MTSSTEGRSAELGTAPRGSSLTARDILPSEELTGIWDRPADCRRSTGSFSAAVASMSLSLQVRHYCGEPNLSYSSTARRNLSFLFSINFLTPVAVSKGGATRLHSSKKSFKIKSKTNCCSYPVCWFFLPRELSANSRTRTCSSSPIPTLSLELEAAENSEKSGEA